MCPRLAAGYANIQINLEISCPFTTPIPHSSGSPTTSAFDKSSYIDHGGLDPAVDQRGELPLLPFENPIGFVPAASREV